MLPILVAAAILATPALPARDPFHRYMRGDLGAGLGLDYGMVGIMGGLDLQGPRGGGISLGLGAGAGLAPSLYLWFPSVSEDHGLRLGLGGAAGSWWVPPGWRGSSEDCGALGRDHLLRSIPKCVGVSRFWALAYSAQLALDHDVGDPMGWTLRYGLGYGVFVSSRRPGRALPMPSVGLRYSF